MTREEAISLLSQVNKILVNNNSWLENTHEPLNMAFDMAIKALEQEPCEDCISRSSIKQKLQEHHDFFVNAYGGFSNLPLHDKSRVDEISNCIAMVVNEPPVNPQPKTGHWLRMSDLSEHEDDRYRCSRCGNVVHYTDKTNLYTFNSWCGRCGSDNGRHMNYEVEE